MLSKKKKIECESKEIDDLKTNPKLLTVEVASYEQWRRYLPAYTVIKQISDHVFIFQIQ